MQAWSGGQYKHVIGRPIFNNENEEDPNISLAFLFSPPAPKDTINRSHAGGDAIGNTISLKQQVLFALLVSVVYHLFKFFY